MYTLPLFCNDSRTYYCLQQTGKKGTQALNSFSFKVSRCRQDVTTALSQSPNCCGLPPPKPNCFHLRLSLLPWRQEFFFNLHFTSGRPQGVELPWVTKPQCASDMHWSWDCFYTSLPLPSFSFSLGYACLWCLYAGSSHPHPCVCVPMHAGCVCACAHM